MEELILRINAIMKRTKTVLVEDDRSEFILGEYKLITINGFYTIAARTKTHTKRM